MLVFFENQGTFFKYYDRCTLFLEFQASVSIVYAFGQSKLIFIL
jgi:hypothetical protein